MIITPENRFGFNQNPPEAEPVPYVQTFNGRTDDVTLTSEDVIDALGYVPGGGGGVTLPIEISDVNGLQTELDGKALLVHSHVIADVTGLQAALDAKEPTIAGSTIDKYWRGDKTWQLLDKTSVGLSNVDNTSDANKPVSTATQTALNTKEGTIAAGTTAQYWRGDKSWQTLDKTSVGLSNVDNTSDANKPVSTATQTALNGKAATGDVTASGLTQTTARMLGRTTAGTGAIELLTAAGVKTFLGISASDVSGLAAIATSASANDLTTGTVAAARMPALTGDVTTSAGAVATTIANDAVSLAKMANVATGTVFYRKTAGTGDPEVQTLATLKTDLGLTGTNTGDQTITLTGNVTGSGTGSFATTIADDVVTYAKMQNVSATNRILGRITAGSGDPEELTAANVKTILALTAADVGALAVAAGAGGWTGYTLHDTTTNGLVVHNTSTNAYSALAVDANSGYFYGQNTDASQWILLGGSLNANTRLPFGSSHGLEFTITPYVGTNVMYHAATAQIVTKSATGGIGYATGAGGTVTQLTSKSTGVTLNKPVGQITMNGAALGGSTSVSFTLTNNQIAATDVVVVNVASGATTNSYQLTVDAVAAGSCRIHIRNISASSRSEAIVLSFAIIKGVTA